MITMWSSKQLSTACMCVLASFLAVFTVVYYLLAC